MEVDREYGCKQKSFVCDADIVLPSMLPRRVFQLLAQSAAAPRSQAATFASAASARLSKPMPSSNGISLEAAVKKVQESATAKFDETVDIAGESLGSCTLFCAYRVHACAAALVTRCLK